MPYTKGKIGINAKEYDVYLRPQAAYTRPTSQSDLTTLLGTAVQIGQVEDKNKKLDIVPIDQVTLDDGNDHATRYEGNLEIKHLNNTLANIDALEDTYDNEDCDAIFHDTNNAEVIVWKDITLHLDINRNHGEPTIVMIKGKKKVPLKSLLEDRFSEPVS